MEKNIISKLLKESSLYEKLIIIMFKSTILKIYQRGMIDCFNYYNK